MYEFTKEYSTQIFIKKIVRISKDFLDAKDINTH